MQQLEARAVGPGAARSTAARVHQAQHARERRRRAEDHDVAAVGAAEVQPGDVVRARCRDAPVERELDVPSRRTAVTVTRRRSKGTGGGRRARRALPARGQDAPPRLHVVGGEAVAGVDLRRRALRRADGFQPAERARHRREAGRRSDARRRPGGPPTRRTGGCWRSACRRPRWVTVSWPRARGCGRRRRRRRAGDRRCWRRSADRRRRGGRVRRRRRGSALVDGDDGGVVRGGGDRQPADVGVVGVQRRRLLAAHAAEPEHARLRRVRLHARDGQLRVAVLALGVRVTPNITPGGSPPRLA